MSVFLYAFKGKIKKTTEKEKKVALRGRNVMLTDIRPQVRTLVRGL